MVYRNSVIVCPVLVAAFSAIAQVQPPPPSRLCYESVTRSCGAAHANTGRICWSTSGSVMIPCGDIILSHGSYGDVVGGESGLSDIDLNCGWGISGAVHKFGCYSSGAHHVQCNSEGVHVVPCKNRCPQGSECSGGGTW